MCYRFALSLDPDESDVRTMSCKTRFARVSLVAHLPPGRIADVAVHDLPQRVPALA